MPELTETALLTADSTPARNYGSELALSLDGDWAVVAAPNELHVGDGFSAQGAVYLYDLSGGAPVQAAKLTELAILPSGLGRSVSISGDGALIAVGIPGDTLGDIAGVYDPDVVPGVGSVMLYSNTGGTVTQIAHLFMDPPIRQAAFGNQVALSSDGGRLMVSGNAFGSAPSGDAARVLVYDMTAAGPVLAHELSATLNPSPSLGSAFGAGIAMSSDGTIAAISAPGEAGEIDPVTGFPDPYRGAVYVWDMSAAQPEVRHRITLPAEQQSFRFGSTFALSDDGSTLAVGGVRLDDPAASFEGKVFVYDLTGADPALSLVLRAPDAGANDNFGAALALSADGSRLSVGATGWDGEVFDPLLGTGQFDVGQTYVFDLDGGTAVLAATLRASDEDRLDSLGATVAISGDGTRALTGSLNGDGTGAGTGGIDYLDQGSAHLFDLPAAPRRIDLTLTRFADTFIAETDDHHMLALRAGDDIARTGAGNDRVLAGLGDDTVAGGAGRDYLFGGAGNDTLDGDAGNDRLRGNSGDDELDGGAGKDRLFGGNGADWLSGGTGNDILAGGADADVFVFAAGFGRDRITDLGADDTIRLSADLWNLAGDLSPQQVIALYGVAVGTTVQLRFSPDDVLRIEDTTLQHLNEHPELFVFV